MNVNEALMCSSKAKCAKNRRKKLERGLKNTVIRTAQRSDNSALSKRQRVANCDTLHPGRTQTKVQSFLHFGQKSFKQLETCKQCGFVFSIGIQEDDKAHAKFCKTHAKGILLPKWKKEIVIKAFSNESNRILELRSKIAPMHRKKLEEIKALMDAALGITDEEQFLAHTHFVYVSSNQIVGYVGSEKISSAYALEIKSNCVPRLNNAPDSMEMGTEAIPVHAGISQLWVHSSYRRKGIARELVDAVRMHLIYGIRIGLDQIAFTQPTADGFSFAREYVAPHTLLTYK